ncbi:HdeD family acid-resistance protein [Pantoea agglomerans]
MIRLIFLLMGARALRPRWLLLALMGLLLIALSVAIFIDMAGDGRLSVPLDTLAILLVVEGIVQLLSGWLIGTRVYLPALAKGVGFLFIAFLVFDVPWDNNLLASLLFGVAFLGDGLFRIASSLVLQGRQWRRGVLIGSIEIVLSLIVFSNWPFHHHITVPLCFALLLLMSGYSLLVMARNVWLLGENASVMSLPLFTAQGMRGPQSTDYIHPPFPHRPALTPLNIHVWTPVGSSVVKDRRLIIDRYIAAVDQHGVISTGHAALEMGELYISHYPLQLIDRDSGNFRAVLRAGEENDVPGRFLPSLPEEIVAWCAPDRLIAFRIYNAEALKNYWQRYATDTTYNLTSRNCSTTVIHALDVAIEGVLGNRTLIGLRLLCDPNFWLLGLVRGRAEEMTWTPGLVHDYVLLLKRVIEPETSRAWHKRLGEAVALRRAVSKKLKSDNTPM